MLMGYAAQTASILHCFHNFDIVFSCRFIFITAAATVRTTGMLPPSYSHVASITESIRVNHHRCPSLSPRPSITYTHASGGAAATERITSD
jgi:hypothetical protein